MNVRSSKEGETALFKAAATGCLPAIKSILSRRLVELVDIKSVRSIDIAGKATTYVLYAVIVT